jgi:hypothetical protein
MKRTWQGKVEMDCERTLRAELREEGETVANVHRRSREGSVEGSWRRKLEEVR